jgi:hypothetical protein
MCSVTDPAREVTPDSPLSSAVLRYSLRLSPTADAPGPHETRRSGFASFTPFSLWSVGRFATAIYCRLLSITPVAR